MNDLNSAAKRMAALTLVSRVSGFVRIAVFAAVFGKTYLSNTYQSANTIPNLMFELFAAGALQAALVPAMVRLRHRGDDEAESQVAGAVLGLVLAALGVVAALAVALGPQLMGLLVADVEDPAIRAQQVELGSTWLWFFMPQVLFYGANIVATSVLNARDSFVIPVAAPIANNMIVIAAYGWFAAVHDGSLTLDISTAETWIVAGGTTLGVVVFCLIPVVHLRRLGMRLRPNTQWRRPEIKRLLNEGAWAAVFLGFTQLLLFIVLRVSNREPGGPVTFQFAFILFTLPHALFSVPILTTRFPLLTRAASDDNWSSYSQTTADGVRSIAFMALGASALTVSVAHPAVTLIAFGQARDFSSEIAWATIGFAPGIIGFGLLLFFTRVRYAVGDSRSPALVNAIAVLVASAVMLFGVSALGSADLVTGLAVTFGAAQVVAALLLGTVIWRDLSQRNEPLEIGLSLLRGAAAAIVAAGLGLAVSGAISDSTRLGALIATVMAAAVCVVIYFAIQWMLGGPSPASAFSTLGAAGVANRDEAET